MKDKEFIIDCEVVYLNEEGDLLPFQDMERRLEETTFKLDLPNTKFPKLYAFDILAMGNQSTCHLMLEERRNLLQQIIEDNPIIKLAERFTLPITSNPIELN